MSDIRPTEGMGVLLRKGSRIKDETTSSLVNSGVYHLADTYDDEEAKKFDGPVVYSFWSAMKYTFTLSLLLWWLPIFGQMIAGYVGGRRAGAPFKGMMSALVPVLFIFAVSTLVNVGIIPTVYWGIDLSPEAVVSVIVTYVPVIHPYVAFVNMYLTSFFTSLHSTASLGLDSYVTTVAFAYIGGVLSQQTHREMLLLSRMSKGTSTTVVLEGNTFTTAQREPLNRRRSRGFEDLEVVDAHNDEIDEVPRTMRSARRAIYDEEEPMPIAPKDRKALKERAQSMAKEQRGVERRVARKASGEDRPERRSSGDKKDWEFI
ncbi:MAG: hypothetical protein ISF22_00565 [Methanomassiliicoccus sp.]|nr:hypothetical protein [Methanomassiliicoccus sp.]